MEQLEADYPEVTFVYMTGHLEGSGIGGSLHNANQQIREYCIENNKTLFDFADIEKYSPAADTNFQEYYANDECNYTHPILGSKNWAWDWLNSHQGEVLEQISQHCSSCSHSVSLNCVKKGIACWHLWARIVGWDGVNTGFDQQTIKSNLTVYPNPASGIIVIETDRKIKMVEVIDIHGKRWIIQNTNTISSSILKRGLYILRVFMEDGAMEVKKVSVI